MTGEPPEETAAPAEDGVLLLTMPQVAALCQVSTDMIRTWTYLPGFPVIRGAHQVRIHAELFQQWLKDRAQNANAA